MTEQEAAFLRAIADDPDDAARLVYADWLDEHGDSARAEFIRVQIELARMTDRARMVYFRSHLGMDRRAAVLHAQTGPVSPAEQFHLTNLVRREQELLETYGSAWRKEVPPWVARSEFWGGFVAEVTCDGPDFLRSADELWEQSPVDYVRLPPMWQNEIAPFIDPGFVPSLSAGDLQRFLTLPHLARLTGLDLAGTSVMYDEGAEWLAASPLLASVTALNLSTCNLGEWQPGADEGVCALAASSYLTKLTVLDLGNSGEGLGNDIGAAGARALSTSPNLSQLTVLDLRGNQVGDEGAYALATSPYLTRLTMLNLEGDRLITNAGATALRERFGQAVRI